MPKNITSITHILHMAYIQPYKDKYRVFVRVKINDKSFSDSKVCRTRRECSSWAAVREAEIRTAENLKPSVKYTLAHLLEKYRDEVSPTKRGKRWEIVRLNKLINDNMLPNDKPVFECTTEALGLWRDFRLQTVKPNTVIREFGLLSSVFDYARRELKWIDNNPVSDARKPKATPHRDVVINRSQIKLVLRALGYHRRVKIESANHRVALCFLIALRTGMRAGELTNMKWSQVFGNYCRLPVTKTTPRDVPLSKKAIELFSRIKGVHAESVFNLSAATLDVLFRRARKNAGLEGFTFHDARHTAATWMARNPRIDVLTLCKIFGWKDTKQALTYYNPKASDIADLLD